MRKSTHSLIISKEGRKKMIDQVKHSVVGELYKTGEKYQARVYHGTIKLYSKRCPLKYRTSDFVTVSVGRGTCAD